jgi:hypothetical protein
VSRKLHRLRNQSKVRTARFLRTHGQTTHSAISNQAEDRAWSQSFAWLVLSGVKDEVFSVFAALSRAGSACST